MGGLFKGPSLPPAPASAPPPPAVNDPAVEEVRRAELKQAQQAASASQTAFGGLLTNPVTGGGAAIGTNVLLGS